MKPLLEDYEAILGLLQTAHNMQNGTPNPQYSWCVNVDGAIVAQTSSGPDEVRLWQAANLTERDFR